jgi:hypothetical protein
MVKVYVHAGLPKTGTTTIQKWLSENAAALRTQGTYTFQNRRLGHRLAAEAITSDKRRSLPDIRPVLEWRLEDSLTALREAVEDEAIDRVVISSEYFSEADPYLVRQLFAELSLDDVKIILVLRRQDRLIEAGYNQSIRAVGLTERIRNPHYHPRYDWYLLASLWANAFGRADIVLRLYEDITLGDAPLIFKIFEGVDADLAAFSLEHGDGEVANPSLPAALLEMQRLANLAGVAEMLPLLEAASKSRLGGAPFRLDPAVAKRWLDCYGESNRKLAVEFFGREGDLFDAGDLDSDSSGADYTGKLPGEIVATILMLYMQDQKQKTEDQKQKAKILAQRILELEQNAKANAAGLQRLNEELRVGAEHLKGALERVRKAESDVARLQDITSPRRLLQIAWQRLTAPFKRNPKL